MVQQGAPPDILDFVVLDDVLVRLRRWGQADRRRGHKITGMELAKWFVEPIVREMRAGARAYVVCADDQEMVPTQKKGTQDRRVANAVVMEGDFTMCDAGLRDGGNPMDTTAVPFYVEDFINNRKLRLRMWQYVRRALIDHPELLEDQMQQFPDFQFVYEFKDGEYTVFPHHFTSFAPPGWPYGQPSHVHGEADTSIAFWVHYWRQHTVLIHSVDGDQLPIQCLALARDTERPKTKVWWQPWELKSCYDMTGIARLVDSTIGAEAFALMTMLMGNDFIDKGIVAYGYTPEDMWPAIGAARDTHGLLPPQTWLQLDYSRVVEAMYAVLYVMYANKWCPEELKEPTSETVQQRWRNLPRHLPRPLEGRKDVFRARYPHEEDFKAVADRVKWNMHYWTAEAVPSLFEGDVTEQRQRRRLHRAVAPPPPPVEAEAVVVA